MGVLVAARRPRAPLFRAGPFAGGGGVPSVGAEMVWRSDEDHRTYVSSDAK
jgi:hypothetical protein